MTFRIHACLATLVLSFVPSLAGAQQFTPHCSTAPVGLEARRSLTGNSWDPAAIVAALVPRGDHLGVATTATDPPASTCGLDSQTDCSVGKSSGAGCEMAAKSENTKKRRQCSIASEPARKATDAFLLDGLIGVDYCIPDALRARLVIARELAKLADEEPVGVARTETADAAPEVDSAESFTVMVPMFETADVAALETNRPSSDSPVIVTLGQREEYLSYDLTAIDRVTMRIFPYGIPHEQPHVQIPMKLADPLESAVTESEGETVAVVTEETVAQPYIPIDCLLDEFVWQASMKLRAGSRFRQSVHPHQVGRKLAQMMESATAGADRLLDAVAALAPAGPVSWNATQPIQLDGQPSVCCPFNPETYIADLETPSGNQSREFVDIDFLAVEEALADTNDSEAEMPKTQPASDDASSDIAADAWSDVVDEIVAAYAGEFENEMGLASADPASEEVSANVSANAWSDVVDEIVAAYAGEFENELGLASIDPASEAVSADVAADAWSDVVDEIVAAYSGAYENEIGLTLVAPASEEVAADGSSDMGEGDVANDAGSREIGVDVALDRAVEEWQKVVEAVQSLSDQWSQRIATQPEGNVVR